MKKIIQLEKLDQSSVTDKILDNLTNLNTRINGLQITKIQTGQIGKGYRGTFGTESDPEWPLSKSNQTGTRFIDQHVTFETPFRKTPKVITAIYSIDASENTGLRITAQPVPGSITPEGFDIRYDTWYNAIIYGVSVIWIAYVEE